MGSKRFRRKRGFNVFHGSTNDKHWIGDYLVENGKLIKFTAPRSTLWANADAPQPMLVKPPKSIIHLNPKAVYEDGEIFWRWDND